MTTTTPDPFTLLGLPASADLTDEQVRTAWRAIATTTHPDLPHGGNPARYAAASAAYTTLRTPWGRSEAYADLLDAAPPRPWHPFPRPAAPRPGPARSPWRSVLLLPARVRHGRPARLVLRVVAAAALAFLATRLGVPAPVVAGLLTGLGTWLVLTARTDLAPPPGR
jgi:hypothetical protein